MASSSATGLTADLLDALPTWLGGTGGGLTAGEQAQLAASEQQSVAAAGGSISATQAASDVKAGSNVPINDPGCTGFSDLSQYTAFSLQWWYCLQDVLANYAIWIIVGLVALVLLWAWASNGFKI